MPDRDSMTLRESTPVEMGPLTFDEVYESHFGFVWRCVVSRGVPRAAVDDVVQEVFLVVHRKLATFEGRSSMRTWLWTIVRRVVRDHLRKRGNASEGEPLVGDQATTMQGPAEALDQKAAVQILESLLAKMSDVQREVFVMFEVEEMTGGEIAEALGVNENTVRTRLRAARQIFSSGTLLQRAGADSGGGMDDQLNPEARRVIELTRAARTPRAEDKERVRRALALGLAATASAPGVAAGAAAVKAAAPVKTAGALGVATTFKVALSVAVIASVGVTSYWWTTRDSRPAAPVALPAPAPVPEAVVAAPPVPEAEPAPEPARVRETPAAAPGPMRDPLMAEVALLHKAQQAWRVGNAARALELAQEHAGRYPRSTLAFERDALRVFALCAQGRKAQARPLAAALVKRAPRSPLRTSVEESCGMR